MTRYSVLLLLPVLLACPDEPEQLIGARSLLAVSASVGDTVKEMQRRDSLHRLANLRDLDSIARDKSAPAYSKRAQARMRAREDSLVLPVIVIDTIAPPPPPPPDTQPPPPPPPPTGPLPVVPGLYGFGTTTAAGRGGAVLRVTNLNDSGVGSLRAALSATGPRVVIFETSGTIALASKLVVTAPFLTVAGQTAPSPGILVRNYGLSIRTHDVLVQHLRFRVGHASTSGNNDGVEILGPNGYNVVVDHVSASWGMDENASTWFAGTNSGAHDVTFANMITAEHFGSGSMLLGDFTKNVAVLNTLFAHNQDRNPYFKGGVTGLMVNTLVYNWGGNQAAYTADPEGSGASQVTIVGNVFDRGPSTPSGRPIQFYTSSKAGSKMFVADNSQDTAAPPSDPWTLVYNQFGATGVATTATLWPANFTALPNAQVRARVLAQAGAYPAFRDAVDQRLIGNVQNGTGAVTTHESQVGGFPMLAVNTRALTLPANPNALAPSGYTNLEVWLHGYAATAEGR